MPQLRGDRQRTVILISGATGAGETTTIAALLAAELGLPLLSKDRLKDTLFDALDYPSGDVAASRS